MRSKHLFLSSVLCFLFCSVTSLKAQQSVTDAILAKSDTPVSFVTWNTDGKSFATTWNNSVILWDADTNTIGAVFSGHNGPIRVVRFSQNGKLLVTLGQDNAVVMRDLDFAVGEARVSGNGFLPINDVVFAENGYSIYIPRDGVNVSQYYRLRLTQQFVSRTITESTIPVQSLDISADGSRLLIAGQDGTVTIIDVKTNSVLGTFPRYALSHVSPRFSPDGSSFIAAADRNSLVISSVTGIGSFAIRDDGQPVNSAVFNADGTRIAVALKDGGIKIYDAATGNQLQWYTVNAQGGSDVVNSLSFSPDGDFLIAGTEAGYILRWSLTGKVFVPTRKQYMDRDIASKVVEQDQMGTDNEQQVPSEGTDEQASAGKTDIQISVPRNGVEINLTANTLNSNYYLFSLGLGSVYRNYALYPLYWGAGAEVGAGIPSGEYEFSSGYINGKRLNDPWIYSAGLFGCFGLCYYLPSPDFLVFTEMRAGAHAKVLYNNELVYYFVGDPVFGGQLDVLMGVQWHFVRAAIGGEYDANFGFLAKANIGGVIKLKGRKGKVSKKPDAKAQDSAKAEPEKASNPLEAEPKAPETPASTAASAASSTAASAASTATSTTPAPSSHSE
ncbi:MAG: hypothetical protein K6G80_05300 [Treponema sp.]|nr:hypothetical protein [Treponema sp.]